MKRFFVLSLFVLLPFVSSCNAPPRSGEISSAAANTRQGAIAPRPFVDAHAVIIVRHADIDPAQKSSMGSAVPLTTRGQERARELDTALKEAGITRIVTSSALRTGQTASPLAAELHLTPEDPFSHGAEGRAASSAAVPEAQTVFEYLAKTATSNETILLVHHHSVIPSLLAQFGFAGEPPIEDATEFDRVYLLIPDSKTHTYQLFRLRYGGKWQ